MSDRMQANVSMKGSASIGVVGLDGEDSPLNVVNGKIAMEGTLQVLYNYATGPKARLDWRTTLSLLLCKLDSSSPCPSYCSTQ